MKIFKLYILLFIFSGLKSKSSTCTATVTGNWENPSVWLCGHVPLCTDNIAIPNGFTVTMTSNQDYNVGACSTQTMIVTISGVLQFQTGKKLTLPSSSLIFVNSGGKIIPSNGGGNSNLITIGTIDVWKAGDGVVSEGTIISSGGLPIELLSFEVENISCGENLIKWKTATETNNDYFEVERSLDAVNFEPINRVNTTENSYKVKTYVYKDYYNLNTYAYYRLKQVDLDGSFTYSNIASSISICDKKQIVRITNLLGQDIPENFEGYKVVIYSDGSAERRFN